VNVIILIESVKSVYPQNELILWVSIKLNVTKTTLVNSHSKFYDSYSVPFPIYVGGLFLGRRVKYILSLIFGLPIVLSANVAYCLADQYKLQHE